MREKLDPADRMDQKVVILLTPSDIERINRYCEAKSKGAVRSRGHVLRTDIMLKVGAWEKQKRLA